MPIQQYKSEMSIVCECVCLTVKIQIDNIVLIWSLWSLVFLPPIEKFWIRP